MQIGVDLIAKLSRSLCAFVPLCLCAFSFPLPWPIGVKILG